MKKRVLSMIGVAICMLVFAFAQPNAYAANSISLTGNKTVRAGDTVSLSFNMNGSGILAFTANLEYDSSLLTLNKVTKTVSGNWLIEQNGNKIVAYDNDQKNPINKSVSVFTLTFTVNKNAATGKELAVKVSGVSASDGDKDIEFGEAKYSVKVSAPKSSNADIAEMKLSNATLSETFASDVTNYNVKVPFSVSALDISVKTSDSAATYKIENNKNFVVGKNTVKITVTAENGTKKTYTLNVEREQDPNYKPSGNSLLSKVTLSVGNISPVFSSEIKDYVVYVPYETTDITVSGTAEDTKATVTSTEITLKEGNNVAKVICTAEDGVGKTEYVINVYRMPKYDGKLPNITVGETLQPTPTPTITPDKSNDPTPTPNQTAEPTPTPNQSGEATPAPSVSPSTEPVPSVEPTDVKGKPINILKLVGIMIVVLAVLGIVVAIEVYVYGNKPKSRKNQ